MYRNRRQFSRGGGSGPGLSDMGIGAPLRNRRFRGQYVRTRSPPDHEDGNGPPTYGQLNNNNSSNNNSHPHQNYNNNHHQQQPQSMRGGGQQHRNSQSDIEEIKDICSKLCVELDLVKSRINEMAGNIERIQVQMQNQHSHGSNSMANDTAENNNTKGRKAKSQKKRDQERAGGDVAGANPVDSTNSTSAVARKNKERNMDRQRRNQRRDNNRDKENKALPLRPQNDDSTTQAADPSSEDKVEGEDGGERVKKVYRRKRQPYARRGYRGRRMDSSERNSNDTSPQNEANGDDYRRSKARPRKTYPELSEAEMHELVQSAKRDFSTSELTAVKKAANEKGPAFAKEFAYEILDHAIQDVTSPTKLSEIANNLAQVLVSDEGGNEFQTGFSSALNELSKRGDDIVIDAPRYIDTVGQVLGQCLVAMNTGRGKRLIKRFFTKSLHSFVQKDRALLLASTMRGIADSKDERFAKEIMDLSNIKWASFLNEGVNLEEFLAEEKVEFTTKKFSPEPRKARRTAEEVEKFADDVTDLVEKRCTTQTLDDLVRDLELETDEKVEYLGTLVYAIVRGCLATDSGESKLDTEALNKYSSILKSQQQTKKEQADAIALHALTALTKLWHTLNCPQNLMSNILLALHGHGAASYESLQTWLNSDDLKSVPGIGAARLNSKRCIEDLGATRT